jgi:16S rRNA processing protein RimM
VKNGIDYLVIGRIVRPFGIRGELKVIPLTDNAERFICLDFCYVMEPGNGPQFHRCDIEQARLSGQFVILKLHDVDTRTDAEKLRDVTIYIDREHAATIDDESHYYYDIEGCTVKTVKGEIMGTVVDIQNAGSCDVYCVRRSESSNDELLIPAVRDVIKSIDIQRKEILIEIVEGLL